jgi:hypothetical protein
MREGPVGCGRFYFCHAGGQQAEPAIGASTGAVEQHGPGLRARFSGDGGWRFPDFRSRLGECVFFASSGPFGMTDGGLCWSAMEEKEGAGIGGGAGDRTELT